MKLSHTKLTYFNSVFVMVFKVISQKISYIFKTSFLASFNFLRTFQNFIQAYTLNISNNFIQIKTIYI
jgi:hypothetical protein